MINLNEDFHLWLDQEVWTEGDEKMMRREYIPDFAEDLTIFMKSCGYTMDFRWKGGHYIVAKWMYMIHVQEFVTKKHRGKIEYADIIHRDWPDDYLEYTNALSFDKIANFMEGWQLYEDFDYDTCVGQRVLHELEDLLYPFIDMERSKNGQLVANDSDSDNEKNYKNKDDIYIMEAREGIHGGRGSKV